MDDPVSEGALVPASEVPGKPGIVESVLIRFSLSVFTMCDCGAEVIAKCHCCVSVCVCFMSQSTAVGVLQMSKMGSMPKVFCNVELTRKHGDSISYN